jgi:hypothetical protein
MSLNLLLGVFFLDDQSDLWPRCSSLGSAFHCTAKLCELMLCDILNIQHSAKRELQPEPKPHDLATSKEATSTHASL